MNRPRRFRTFGGLVIAILASFLILSELANWLGQFNQKREVRREAVFLGQGEEKVKK